MVVNEFTTIYDMLIPTNNGNFKCLNETTVHWVFDLFLLFFRMDSVKTLKLIVIQSHNN